MDVLIKNMGYPQSCGVCRLKYNEYLKMMDEDKYGTKTRSVSKVFHVCHLVGHDVTEFADSGKRCPDCPLIEVPPHGDLIDRDELLTDLADRMCVDDMLDGIYQPSIDRINEAKTVLEANYGEV